MGLPSDSYEVDFGYSAEGRRRMSDATIAGTGSLPESQSRTSVGHTPSFSASRAFPHEMRRNSRFNCAGVKTPPIVLGTDKEPQGSIAYYGSLLLANDILPP
jgi:hypothetical protein